MSEITVSVNTHQNDTNNDSEDGLKIIEKIHFPETSQEVSGVAHMFNGRSVFITGASGFIGRVLLEKLLRCYTGIKRVYILMRPKKNEQPQERLHKRVLNVPLFDGIRSMEKDACYRLLEKIVVVSGDISEPQLGISETDMQMMLDDESLSIIFHSAATIRFDEPLKVSVQLNLIATRTIIDFSRKLKNLISLCHVSTAYANSHLPESVRIEEKLYPIRWTPQQVIRISENLDETSMQALKSDLVANRPNTYTYTKALAEHLIATEATDLPVAIVRPSIVVAAWKDPLPGWIDNINGPTGLLLAIGKGLLRTMHIVSTCRAEIIPVDVVVNAMVASAYYAAKINNKLEKNTTPAPINVVESTPKGLDGFNETKLGFLPAKHPPIFHINSGDLNPIRWHEMEDSVFPIVKNYPSLETYRYPFGSFKNNKYHDLLMRLFVHYLPALILDGICLIMGKKRRLMWIYGKLHNATKTLAHFTTYDYKFATKNLQLLRTSLNQVDRKQLFMDIENIKWISFWNDYVLGCRRYMLKEKDSTLEQARQNFKRSYMIELFIRGTLILILGLCLAPFVTRMLSSNLIEPAKAGLVT